MKSEIEKLIKEINLEDGLDLKLNINTCFGNLENIYFDKYKEDPKISPHNTLKLYKGLSFETGRKPIKLLYGYSYCKMNSFKFKNKQESINLIEDFLKKEHLLFPDFDWYINILFKNDLFYDDPHQELIWDSLKNNYENDSSLFLYANNIDNSIYQNIRQYVEDKYGFNHNFKYVFLSNIDKLNDYDIKSDGTEPIQGLIRIQKL